MLAGVENAQLARRLTDETVHRHEVDPTALTIHSDRGVPAAKPGAPQPPELPETVYINPPQEATSTH